MRVSIAISVGLIACGGEAEPPEISGQGGAATIGCAPGEVPLEVGGCRPAGVRQCAEGFVSDGHGGCSARLPSEPCPPGLMAVPGDEACREIAPCGAPPWGDIPVEASTEYVDGSFVGTSTGSADAPWSSIGQAIAAARPDDIVAVAAGDYLENAALSGKAVRLWGRCPSLVTMHGGARSYAAVDIAFADGAEVHTIAITGGRTGVRIRGSTDVVLDRVRIHDTAERGLNASDGATVSLRESLIETAHEIGAAVYGSSLTLAKSELRDTLPGAASDGRGIEIQSGTLIIEGSHLHRQRSVGVLVAGADATIEASVLRDAEPSSPTTFGFGVVAQPFPGQPAALSIVASVVEQSVGLGVRAQGASLIMEDTVVRDTQSPDGVEAGVGLVVQVGEEGEPAEGAIRWSVVEGSFGLGIGVYSATAALDGVIVRDTLAGIPEGGGGIVFEPYLPIGLPSAGVVRWCVVDNNQALGVVVNGTSAVVEDAIVRRTQPSAAGTLGRGFQIQAASIGTPSQARILRTLIEENIEFGVVLEGANLELVDSMVRATKARGDGQFGDGLAIAAVTGPSHAVVQGCTVSESARAGAAVFGGSLELSDSKLLCNQIDLTGQTLLSDPTIVDLGGNSCGCETPAACKSQSTMLEPPPPL